MTNEGPALDSRVLTQDLTKVRLSLPLMEAVALDLVHLMGMARRVARRDSVSLASAPQQP